MKKTAWSLVLIFTIAGTVACVAQSLANLGAAPATDPTTVTNATGALGALLHYIFPNVNITTIGAVVGLLVGGSKWLRNVIPDKWQVNKAGLWLSSIAGDLNPTMAKQIANAAEEALAKSSKPATASAASVTPPTAPKI